jgi:hypothetical protein
MTLSEGFALVRDALVEAGEQPTDGNEARERMIQRRGSGDDPLFEPRRFQRFLRQAHDAGVIDLIKAEDGIYLLKLRPEQPDTARAGDASPVEDADRGPRRRRGARGGRGRRRGEHRPDEATDAPPRRPPPEAFEAPPAPTVASPEPRRDDAGRRNPRFRRGSRGPAAPPPKEDPGYAPPTPETADAAPVSGPIEHNRSLRGRTGRGRRPPTAPPGSPESEPASPAPAPPPPPEPPPSPTRRRSVDEEMAAVRAMAEQPPAEPREPEAAEGGSLFKRMSAALQRAMGQPPKDDDQQDS